MLNVKTVKIPIFKNSGKIFEICLDLAASKGWPCGLFSAWLQIWPKKG